MQNVLHWKLRLVIWRKKIATGSDSERLSHVLDDSLTESLQKLNAAKKELAARLRAIVSINHQLDDAPSQSELIRYECWFSELNAHIQFQDAIASTAGRMKLLESMDGIVKGSQQIIWRCTNEAFVLQKLEKVQLGLQEEQKVCDAFKERYTAAVAEQRHCYSLLKAFQKWCKNRVKPFFKNGNKLCASFPDLAEQFIRQFENYEP